MAPRLTVPEAAQRATEHGLVREGEGWFVVNAREARWRADELGAHVTFEGDHVFVGAGEGPCLLLATGKRQEA